MTIEAAPKTSELGACTRELQPWFASPRFGTRCAPAPKQRSRAPWWSANAAG